MPYSLVLSAVALTVLLGMPPASLPHQDAAPELPPDVVAANAVVQGFVRAMRDSDWTKAIGYCSAKVVKDARTYPSAEAFFRDVVPIKQLVAQTKDPIYSPSPKAAFGRNQTRFFTCSPLPVD